MPDLLRVLREPRKPLRPARFSARHRGAVLIIAIGVLTLLAILGATFANLMRLEKQATQNFVDSQEADLLNDTALEHVIAELRGASNWWSYTPYRATWMHKLKGQDDLAHGLEGSLYSPLAGDWEVVSKRQRNVYRYKVKVIDTSAQININGKQDSLGRMLDNLGRAIATSPRLKVGVNPFWSGPRQSGNLIPGSQIIQFRNKLEGNRFRSKTQLQELIGRENFELVKDFITVESYVDPYTYKADDGLNEILELGDFQAQAGGRALGGGTGVTSQNPVENPGPRMSPEPRSPINLNTAPEEVLIACLMGIGARRAFPYSRITYTPIDQGAMAAGQTPMGKEEHDTMGGIGLQPRGVWVYSDQTGQGFPYERARALAQRIIAQRKQTPFLTWSTGEKGQPGGFAEFINDLEDSFFPAPETALVVDPRLPGAGGSGRIHAEICRGGSQEMSRMWIRGHDPLERSVREEKGLPYHTRNAFYFEMMKAAIIANANPNSRISRYNSNGPAYTPVDKSDLVRLDRDRITLRKGHTTEFCFDTGGIYEVTTLAEIAEQVGSGTGGAGEFRSLYQKPMRTVVKVFDVLRHTSQLHFEKTFALGERSSRQNRRYVITWPDPMVALTEAVSMGSKRDGRVELAGHNDGRRLLAPPAQRFQSFQSPQSILMAHGFQDRDDASFAQLRRLGRIPGTGMNDELLKVLNASFSRRSKRLANLYTRQELSTLGFLNQTAMNLAPQVNTEQLGTYLRPDGYHQSIFTTSHLGGAFVHLPAHERMGDSTKAGPARFVGAGFRQNSQGNVPYYDGGMAFWVKFDFNGDDPVFSGLIGCTQVVEDVGMEPSQSEGTQFYIFKNSDGFLRIVRMYYHQAFPEGSGGGEEGGGGEGGEGITLWPPSTSGDGEAGGGAASAGENPIVEHLDPRKVVARADYIIDVRKFRAREWHHIAVDWKDDNPGLALQVHIDFEKMQGGGPFIRHEQTGDTPSAWVRLNCRRPRDELFVGGFIRAQGVSDAGVFKWFTNTASMGGAGSGLQTVEPTVKKILANATIDELITYEDNFQAVRNYYGTGGQGYFTNQRGIYANVFEVPLPPEVDFVLLRSFDWTSYYPASFTTRDGQSLQIVNTPMQCQLFLGRELIMPFDEPWRPARRSVQNPVANRRLQRRETKGLLGTNADLVYEFSMYPGKVQAGPLAGGSVQTPVLDDVTVTYFLPDPKILLQEEAEEKPSG